MADPDVKSMGMRWRIGFAGVWRFWHFEGTKDSMRIGYLMDAKNAGGNYLPTGLYPVDFVHDERMITRFNRASRFAGTGQVSGLPQECHISYPFRKEAVVVNHQDSPFGAGWTLKNLSRLHMRCLSR